MFAVIRTGGKQYKVAAEDTLRIERLDAAQGDVVTFEDVLMVGAGADVALGTPLVEGAVVAAELVEHTRGDKIIVFKKKRRQNYRRRNGHRQDYSVVRITEILTGGKKPSATRKAAPARAEAKPETGPEAEVKSEAKPAASKAPAAGTATVADDVKLIGGVGPALEKKLAGLGVTSLSQIAAFTEDDIARIDAELNFKGRIERDDWIGQARDLLAGEPPRAKADQKAADKDGGDS